MREMECARCGDEGLLLYTCTYCGDRHCSTHRLPEAHACPFVGVTTRPKYWGQNYQVSADAQTGSGGDGGRAEESDAVARAAARGDRNTIETDSKQRESNALLRILSLTLGAVSLGWAGVRDRGRRLVIRHNRFVRRLQRRVLRWKRWRRRGLLKKLGWLVTLPALLVASMGVSLYAWTWNQVKTGIRHRRAIVVTVALVAVAAAVVGTAPFNAAVDDARDGISRAAEDAAGVLHNMTNTSTSAPGDTPGQTGPTGARGAVSTPEVPAGDLNTTRVERLVHAEINDRRRAQGLSRLSYDSELAEVAEYYSGRMASEGFFSHTAPDGETMSDRYSRFGYNCRVPLRGHSYATGGENLAATYYRTSLISEGDSYYSSEEELARGVVNQWMNSSGHRENILTDYWRREGLGVVTKSVDGNIRVLATQNFC